MSKAQPFSREQASSEETAVVFTFACMRAFICLIVLGCVQPAVARLDMARCLRGYPGGHTHPHVCTPTPRTDHAGNGRVG